MEAPYHPVAYFGKEVQGPLYVVEHQGPSLCRRDLIKVLNLPEVDHIERFEATESWVLETVQELEEEFRDLVRAGMGLMKGPAAHANLKKEVNSKFFKPCSLPWALRDRVAAGLDLMCQKGILSSVSHSDWATPVFPVHKPNGSLRICGFFKVTLNLACDIEQCPLPKVEDIFASLEGDYWFSELNLQEAYCNVLLDEESKQVAVLNAHKTFSFNRLPYRITSAPALFQ